MRREECWGSKAMLMGVTPGKRRETIKGERTTGLPWVGKEVAASMISEMVSMNDPATVSLIPLTFISRVSLVYFSAEP
jgi:hypothetical protein